MSAPKIPAFGVYDFMGNIVPGTVTLVLLGLLFDLSPFQSILAPDNFGSLGVHVILAYFIGHLVQFGGNLFEQAYWRLWSGMPTDWPFSGEEDRRDYFKGARQSILIYTDRNDEAPDVSTWRSLISQARSSVYNLKYAGRLQTFNANYGMFRGVISALLAIVVLGIVAALGWIAHSNSIPWALFFSVLGVVILISVFRFHRFGRRYAEELFAVVADLNLKNKKKKEEDKGEPNA